MKGRTAARAAILMCSGLMLQGCFEAKLERWNNRETYEFNGEYINQYNDDRLIFNEGMVYHESGDMMRTSKTFRVEGDFIYIQLRNSSKEKREDIAMRIHGSGELLTCQMCARHQLSHVWQRELDTKQ